jgi:hypothetical protein
VLSLIQVTVLEAVAVLPQPSMAVNVLVCEEEQLLLLTVPSLDVMVGLPQPSVAVAEPKALLISLAVGLQPRVILLNEPVNTGAVLSRLHVTVEEAVALLPQPSEAVKVLVCEAVHAVVVTAPSVKLIAGVPHAAEAVAVPSAALISEADGLHPSVAITPVTVIVGGLGELIQLTVLVTVALLPQASTAVNVLTCEAEQDVVDIAPSEEVIVTGPQPSVADAEPRALAISLAVGLQPSATVE